MANYTCPPQKRLATSVFSDNLVGTQLVTGGGITQGNFQFTTSFTEKSNRTFDTGVFSNPITLDSLSIKSVAEAQKVFEVNFKVYPNFDEENILNFVAYGPLSKRFSAAVLNIINHYPAALEVNSLRPNYTTGSTAYNITYNSEENLTQFVIDISTIRNPFGIDFSVNATRNLSTFEVEVSEYRNMTTKFRSYSLFTNNDSFGLTNITATTNTTSGELSIQVLGRPFSSSTTFENLIIRPNDFTVNQIFNLELDEVEELLLDRFSYPKYTAKFKILTESNDGTEFFRTQTVTWPLNGLWNIDISTAAFTNYISKLDKIGASFDENQTDLMSRFYTTEAFKEFDTIDNKVAKSLKIYGRSFDETKKYADSISHMTSVNYNVGNDVPDKLLINLIETLGWNPNISPIQNDGFLNTIYETTTSQFAGQSTGLSLDEIQYQYYRNLLMNSAYLFKAKGTRKAIEFLMNNIGAPEALLEFNEHIYKVDNKIQLSRFDSLYSTITGGTFTNLFPTLDPNNVYRFQGAPYTAYTQSTTIQDVSITKEDYPVDSLGYPKTPVNTDSFYFQKGEGWFESTTQHRSPEIINTGTSVFTGQSPSVQTSLEPFTYGEKYLDRFRRFPYLGMGFGLEKTIDNKKSWTDQNEGLRKNANGNFDAYYEISDDRLVMNVKNVDLFLNPAQALAYDVWYLSRNFDYPIPFTGLSSVDNVLTDIDWTIIDPKPQIKDFFEFKETFWKNLINVRNRMQSTDGKTSGYPTLLSIFYKYLTMYEDEGIQNNNFSYQNMTQYINKIGDYWIRLVEQFIPATTIWNTGSRIENSVFHRQKFIYRLQRGCLPINIALRGPQVSGGVFKNSCSTVDVDIPVQYDLNTLQKQLSNLIAESKQTCKAGAPIIKSLQYAFQILLTKDGISTTLTYIDNNLYFSPNEVMTSTQWDTFITQGVGFLMGEFLAIGTEVSYDKGVITVSSEDCIQIDSAEFNLQFINVNLACK
jgi:hypothetical protein